MEMSHKKYLQDGLRVTTVAQLGQFGEMLFERIHQKKRIGIDRVHSNGVDFVVDGIGLVDLKTRRKLDKPYNGKVSKYNFKLPSVVYCYLYLCSDQIILIADANESLNQLAQLSWSECEEIMWDFRFRDRKEISERQTTSIKHEVRNWIFKEWGLEARVISRSGRSAQQSFERNGWGPNNFHANAKAQSKFDLILLLFFDNGEIYQVYAYPVKCIKEIDWFPKNRGPNLSQIMIFDPRVLDKKFVFSSLDEFKQSFIQRFGLLKDLKLDI